MTQSDILMDEVYPLFRQLEKIRYRNSASRSLKGIEFNFEQGTIKFIYNKASKPKAFLSIY